MIRRAAVFIFAAILFPLSWLVLTVMIAIDKSVSWASRAHRGRL